MARGLDLTGKRFGRLTVVERTDQRDGNSIIWKCLCDCGNTAFVSAKNLVHHQTFSCGCQRKDSVTETLAKVARPRLGIVDHTNLSKIASNRPQSNSTTGVRGVTRLPDGRYEVFINVKRKRIRIGRYYTLEEARAERERAVERYFKPLLDEWRVGK